ncbi:hypothetical protein N7462_003011 [Penicillium macrosclerotiorum]|uniref:uncharacterized protein n=1 Tax=Penicillium macrosclerotiorum TaxID=303699 RepID=UPI00254909FD|nr:uncharacterized protein N7462_003011 [Penicillium macrosclerotiorum]KAJ5688619.1 hypothetical protein N7462_003011 [Penicillium macrosclerotiorum]
MVHPRLWWAPLALTTLLWTAPTVASDDRNCYNPDGSQAADDVPCTSDDTTFCCNKKDLCMSNGLCYMQRNSGLALSRASCTDQSWDSCDDYKYCCELCCSPGLP